MRFAVIQFGGSNCDRDALHVISDICGWIVTLSGIKKAFPPV